MLSIPQVVALTLCAGVLLSCSRSAESNLIGEWNCPSIEPEARVIYKADHTYTAWIRNSRFTGATAGTWRVEGDQIICRDEHGESKGQILKIAGNKLEIKAPDGITRTYERLK